MNSTNLPPDCINIINEYLAGLEHRDNLNMLREDLLIQAAIKRFSPKFHDSFDMDIMDRDEALKLINILFKCNCCLRHQKNKPGPESFINYFVPPYKQYASNKSNCNCACRYTCRHICRLMNDEFLLVDD